VLYIIGDMTFYLVQKVLRGDFRYWFPIDGASGLLVSLLMRVASKTMVDFTGVINFRHPNELGGLYWTMNMFLALAASFGSVWVYAENGGEEVGEKDAWMMVGCLGGAWFITFAVFLGLMKKGYRRTFFSTTSGKANTSNYFLLRTDESVRCIMITDNKLLWREMRADVKTWVLKNWWRWMEEKPDWFTEAWVKKLPDDFIPADDDEVKLEAIRKKGRRRSAGDALDIGRIHPIKLI